MNDRSDGLEKTIWQKMIKQNMVQRNVNEGQSIFTLNDKKNRSVEIHFGARDLLLAPQRPGQVAQMQPVICGRSDTLDISSVDFLIVNKHPAVMKFRQYIPWKKIVEIIFVA